MDRNLPAARPAQPRPPARHAIRTPRTHTPRRWPTRSRHRTQQHAPPPDSPSQSQTGTLRPLPAPPATGHTPDIEPPATRPIQPPDTPSRPDTRRGTHHPDRTYPRCQHTRLRTLPPVCRPIQPPPVAPRRPDTRPGTHRTPIGICPHLRPAPAPNPNLRQLAQPPPDTPPTDQRLDPGHHPHTRPTRPRHRPPARNLQLPPLPCRHQITHRPGTCPLSPAAMTHRHRIPAATPCPAATRLNRPARTTPTRGASPRPRHRTPTSGRFAAQPPPGAPRRPDTRSGTHHPEPARGAGTPGADPAQPATGPAHPVGGPTRAGGGSSGRTPRPPRPAA